MRSVRDEFERESKSLLADDLSRYLWVVRFFTGYHFISQKTQANSGVIF